MLNTTSNAKYIDGFAPLTMTSWFPDALVEGSGWGRAAHANYDVKCQIHRWIRFAHHDFVVFGRCYGGNTYVGSCRLTRNCVPLH